MKKLIRHVMLLCLLFGLFTLLMLQPALAVPSPGSVQKAKDEAPLHVIGTIEEDSKLRDHQEIDGTPTQIRKATLRIQEVKKQPASLTMAQGDTVDFYYWYYPPEAAVVGPARVHVVKGDRIEVWLKQGEYGWMPAMAGSTLSVLQPAAERSEPIPPRAERIAIWWQEKAPWLGGALLTLFVLYRYVFKRPTSNHKL